MLTEKTESSKKILVLTIVLVMVFAGIVYEGWLLHVQEEKISELENQLYSLSGEIEFLTEKIKNLSGTTFNVSKPCQPSSTISISHVYENVKDSVVVVRGIRIEILDSFFGPISRIVKIEGSGFVCEYNNSFYILTNNHVVSGVQNITVTFLNGNAYPAKLIGSDVYSDLAVLTVNAPSSEFKPLKIVSSSSLHVGDPVIAVGNPFGLSGTVTTGIVSQLGRTIREPETGGYAIADVIQTTAPINPGNSGGPLLNYNGEVVGITTAIIPGAQNIGFAIPSDTILRELPSLIKRGTYIHPWLGVTIVDVTPAIANFMKLNVTYGVLVESVIPGGPADKAGIKAGKEKVQIEGQTVVVGGDVIIAVNHVKIRNQDDLSTYLERNTRPNQTVQLTIIRNKKIMEIPVTIGTRPPPK
ncbi:trypsin [Candidatus Bathyarchaeota archaeon]|nr:MAG: trypsin [Candidatus Bathyarchaeota archaeon]